MINRDGGGPSAIPTFLAGTRERLPDPHKAFSDLFTEMDLVIRESFGKSKARSIDQALSKIHGDWFEFLLSIAAQNVHVRIGSQFVAITLPNKSRFNCELLYEPRYSSLVTDLRRKVEQSAGVVLISSNPDFVIVRANCEAVQKIRSSVSELSDIVLTNFRSRYQSFSGRCGIDDIAGYLGAKFTLKPDRRLQLAHEGSLMKALYVHLQTREWILAPPGIRYYAAASTATKADIYALRTVATHSITSVTSDPQRAVDELFVVNCMAEAEQMFERIYKLSEMNPPARALSLAIPSVSGIEISKALEETLGD